MLKKYFQTWCNVLELSPDIVDQVESYKIKITNCVDRHFESDSAKKYSGFIGSYGRGTAVYTDRTRLLVALPEEYYWRLSYGKTRILKELLNALRRDFLSCDYSDDNSNELNLNIDGDMGFDIVPGFAFNDGVYVYLHADGWKTLNLKIERENFSKANEQANDCLIRLCKLLKVWKAKQEITISNILLDTYAYNYCKYYMKKDYSFDTYDEMVNGFFAYLKQNCKKDSVISFDGKTKLNRKADISQIVSNALIDSQSALSWAGMGDESSAINNWVNILGYPITNKR